MEINSINMKLQIAEQLFNQLKHNKANKSAFDFIIIYGKMSYLLSIKPCRRPLYGKKP
jgi:hypothetical protein